MTTLFWLLVFASAYSYFGYPLLLLLMPRRRGDGPAGALAEMPRVSLIITAYNEEKRILDKLRNTVGLDYPDDLLDIIVASDCSDDETEALVRKYREATGDERLRLVRADERRGKEHAQYCAIGEAWGDILVFSDVATQLPENAILRLVQYFGDPMVGAVSSEDRFITPEGVVVGEGAYVRYEMWLRRMESSRAGLVGLSGSFFAARKSVCEPWDIYSPSDFKTALNCAQQDLVAVTAPDVLGCYTDIVDSRKEYQRKVRTALRGMTALSRHSEVLNPFEYGWFAMQLWSHKIMRWAVPWALLSLFGVSLLLRDQGFFYQLILVAQLIFYGLGLLTWVLPGVRSVGLMALVFFFLQVNAALAEAFLKLIRGERAYIWQPSQR